MKLLAVIGLTLFFLFGENGKASAQVQMQEIHQIGAQQMVAEDETSIQLRSVNISNKSSNVRLALMNMMSAVLDCTIIIGTMTIIVKSRHKEKNEH